MLVRFIVSIGICSLFLKKEKRTKKERVDAFSRYSQQSFSNFECRSTVSTQSKADILPNSSPRADFQKTYTQVDLNYCLIVQYTVS